MPKVILAKTTGFCFGVQRAVDIVLEARSRTRGPITSLGPIVHNDQVAGKLRAEGVEAAADLGEIRQGAVILSAHGVSPATEQQARDQGLDIVDVTCPFVTRVHRTAQTLVQQGYQLLLVGEEAHSEVKGIVGAVHGRVSLVSGPEDVKKIKLSRKVGIVTQTTQKAETFAAVVAEVSKTVFDVRAFNTICNATDELQEAAIELAHKVDVVIVVGGRQSANTARLRQICEDEGVPSYHIETSDEVQDEWIAGKETIGLTAGASTPDWLIESVARRLNGGDLPDDFNIQHPDERTMTKFFGATSNLGGRELAQIAS
jgi:4-hydroxy-3-methylbut-2-enyl diphosphate reductase